MKVDCLTAVLGTAAAVLSVVLSLSPGGSPSWGASATEREGLPPAPVDQMRLPGCDAAVVAVQPDGTPCLLVCYREEDAAHLVALTPHLPEEWSTRELFRIPAPPHPSPGPEQFWDIAVDWHGEDWSLTAYSPRDWTLQTYDEDGDLVSWRMLEHTEVYGGLLELWWPDGSLSAYSSTEVQADVPGPGRVLRNPAALMAACTSVLRDPDSRDRPDCYVATADGRIVPLSRGALRGRLPPPLPTPLDVRPLWLDVLPGADSDPTRAILCADSVPGHPWPAGPEAPCGQLDEGVLRVACVFVADWPAFGAVDYVVSAALIPRTGMPPLVATAFTDGSLTAWTWVLAESSTGSMEDVLFPRALVKPRPARRRVRAWLYSARGKDGEQYLVALWSDGRLWSFRAADLPTEPY